MGSQPEVGDIELQVLATVGPAGGRASTIAERLGKPDAAVRAAVVRLVQADLLRATADGVALTPRGQLAVERAQSPRHAPGAEGRPVPTIDLTEVARLISDSWPTSTERAAAEEAARDELLASDADRDTAVQQLSDAFSQGRLSSTELEQRTGRALAARTYGDLDDVLKGLGGLPRQASRHPVRRTVFFVVAFLCSPFVMTGALFLAFGTDVGDHVFGLVFLVLLLPGLFGLWRWAWPRR